MNFISHLTDTKQLSSFLYETRFIILFYVIGDFITTMHALQYGFEENGFLSFVMEQYSIWSLLILKLLFLGLVYYNYLNIRSADSKLMYFLWSASKKGIALVGAFLVVNNLLVICGSYSLIQIIRFMYL
jgi:hypothetical protein